LYVYYLFWGASFSLLMGAAIAIFDRYSVLVYDWVTTSR
jgi:hypothetical protein